MAKKKSSATKGAAASTSTSAPSPQPTSTASMDDSSQMSVDPSTDSNSTTNGTSTSHSTPVTEQPPSPLPEPEVEPSVKAEQTKEKGNVAFKAKRYGEAIDLYTQAVDLVPTEPAYMTNRAAAYMALKRFRPALDDCQAAAALQASAPSVKTLVRLARCQLALGSTTPSLSTLKTALEIDPSNTAALDLKRKVEQLESHLRNFEGAREREDWSHARLALDQALRSIEGEGGDIPIMWRMWRVELEIARGNWNAANSAAGDGLRIESKSVDMLTLRGLVLFLTGKLPQALQHATEALRLDPGSEAAQRLRKRVKEIERLKEDGNNAFKAGRLQEAVDRYSETLEQIGQAPKEGKGGQIRATLLSNRATAFVKLERFEEALADIDESLVLSPGAFKPLRTRARIHLHAERYEEAVTDFRSAAEQAEHDGATADVRALKADLKKAEIALKRSKTKDYYKILGVARDCNDTDIKKAYRKESLKHHPDKGGDEEKFKLVVEAHSVLSDPQRRERYDMGEDEDGASAMGGGGMGGGMGGVDISELFAQFHGGGGGGGFGGGGFPGAGGPFGGGGHGHTHGGFRSGGGGGQRYGFEF